MRRALASKEGQSAMLVTAAICTHNRPSDVAACLEALAPAAQAAGMPVLVVDSGSPAPGATALRILSEAAGASLIRVDEPGLSLARNAALEAAETEWIVYVDDDATPRERWAEGLTRALSSAPEDVAVIGGRIKPRWPAGVSTEHVDASWMLLLSCVDEDGTGDVAGGRKVCGANLAVRRAALRAIGGFPVSLGRRGKRLISCEESFVIERLGQAGLRACYDGGFAVDHHIQPERLQLGWARRRAYWEGASRVRMLRELGRPIPWRMNMVKLGLSLPWLRAKMLAANAPEAALRYERARGSLAEQLGVA